MKNHLNAHEPAHRMLNLILAASLALPLPALAAAVALASSPLATSSTTTVMPNVMFVLDDSGSMDWDYMPDDSKNFAGKYGFNANHCNGVYYNPLITYTPPVYATGTSYPDASFTGAWKSGYNTGLGTVNLDTGFTGGSGSGSSGAGGGYTGPAFYYEYLTATTTPAGPGTQTANWQQDFHNTNSIFYKECISAVGSTTAVDGTNPVNTVFKKVRLASTPTTTISIASSGGGATITVSGNKSTKVSNVTVNGVEILDATTNSTSSSKTTASNIAAGINNCTKTKTGLCTIVGGTGFSATCPGYPSCTSSVVTITGPGSAGGFSPVVTNGTCTSPCMSYTYSAFPTIASTYVSGIRVNGVELLLSGSTVSSTTPATLATSLAASINATGYTATASGSVVTVTGPTSASTYTPVITAVPATGGLTLTTDAFPESTPAKLKNFANWYSYYSNRMLMMKTGVGQAFSPIDAKYRVGFMTMNNNVSPDIAEIAPFDATQRSTWYSKLYDATPGNSTPLREALSHVGQMYAHKFGDYDVYTATITVGGSGSTVVESVSVNEGGTAPVETMAGTAVGSTSTSTVAANIAAQINLKDPSNYGASVSGNVIKITGPVSALNSYPVILDDGGGMTFSSTAFVKSTVHAQLNGITPKDPVQYSCQQNFVILSTDGYWNGSTTYDLSSPNQPVGNQDGTAPRAMYDGGLFTKTTTQTSQRQTQLTEIHTQLQSRTTQVQSSTSNLQSQTSQQQMRSSTLQTQTSQLQTQTSTLQTQTSQLQTATSTLQKQTSQLQTRTGKLQTQTSQLRQDVGTLQSRTSQLQISTSTLQTQTSQLQKQTSTLQGTLSKVLMTCSGTLTACGTAPATGSAGVGSGTASWTVVSSGTCTVAINVQCQRVSGLSGATNVATKCDTSATISNTNTTKFVITVSAATTTTTFSSIKIDGQEILTGTTTAAGSGGTTVNRVATNIAAKVGTNGYTATVSNNVVTVTGTTFPITASSTGSYSVAVSSATLTAGITGSNSYTLANADSNGKIYSACSYADGLWVPVSTCATVTKSSSSPYTVLTSTQCQTAVTSPWANTTSNCTVTTTPDASGNTTQCQYVAPGTTTVNGWSAWTDTSSTCTAAAQSAGPTNYTVHPAVKCQYAVPGQTTVGWSNWASAASCTPLAQTGASPYTTTTATECQYSWTTAQGTPSCSAPAYVAGNYANATVYQNCATAVTSAFTNAAAACTETTTPNASGNTTQCRYWDTTAAASWSTWAGTTSCALVPADFTNLTARDCQTAVTTAWANATAACTPTTTPNASGNTTQCQYATPGTTTAGWSTWAGASTCATAAQNNTNLTARDCQTVATTAWTNATAACTATTTPNASGYTTQCQYATPGTTTAGWSTWAGASTCATAAQNNTNLTARNCQTAVTAAWANATAACTATTAPNASGNTTQCQYATPGTSTPGWSAWAGTSSCTAVAQDYTSLTALQCQNVVTLPYANVSSCTENATPDASGNTTQCQYAPWGAWANTSSCTPVAQSAASPYTVGAATQCQTADTGWVGTASCANSGPTNGRTVYCNTPNSPVVLPGYPLPVASCTPQSALPGNSYVTISCSTATVQGSHLVASCTQGNTGAPDYKQTYCTTTTIATVANASSCVAGNSGAPSFIQTTCTGGAGGTADTLADVAMYYYQTDIRDTSLANCTGVLGSDVCYNNVFISGADNNVHQHMTTFTLGLGARGRMVYTSKNYMNDTSGDFYSVKLGSATNLTTTPPVCNWQTAGSVCNWPIPSSSSINNIDDLWHAAVNGRGTYFSASDPASLSDGLSSALSSITARKGAAAAAATSTLNPVAGNNFAYVASYTTVKWIGNLEARTIDTTNGLISKNASWCVDNLAADVCAAPSTVVTTINGSSTSYDCVTPNATTATCLWPNVFDSVANTCAVPMAMDCVGKLPPMVGATSDTRKIITANSSGTGFVDFYYANLTPTQQTYFNTTTLSGLSQWSTIVGLGKQADAQANIVNYLRGQYGYDDRATNLVSGVDNRLFRFREAVLGDALESQPSFIAAPTFSYADAGYSVFVTNQANRPGTVYMGTNDGMLHAFVANTDATLSPPEVGGTERWAFVPTVVMPNMWKLADADYSVNHVNYVNGSPVISDIFCGAGALCPGGASGWRTILVGGLNAGGREYYALDITDPKNPLLLWEFTPTVDANLGYTFGVPVVTKMANGTWVVLVTSGYDNGSLSSNGLTAHSPAGDGIGRLYVLDARTGAIIKSLSTGVGTAATPSGLGKISVWNNATESNVAGYTYGGDLLGNVWRFDINASASPGVNPLLFATLKDPSGVAQPITSAPILGMVAGKHVVFVGTGKYLETSDLGNTQKQSLYAIKDDGATATLVNPGGTPRNSLKLVQQTITPTGGVRVGSYNKVDFTTDRGWYVDFPDVGERVNIDGKLVLGTLLVPTIVPASTVCSPGGYGWLNFFDYTNGWPTTDGTGVGAGGTNKNVSVKFDASIVGMNILFINGKPVVEVVTSDNPTPTIPPVPPVFNTGNSTFTGKRMQWRELIP